MRKRANDGKLVTANMTDSLLKGETDGDGDDDYFDDDGYDVAERRNKRYR